MASYVMGGGGEAQEGVDSFPVSLTFYLLLIGETGTSQQVMPGFSMKILETRFSFKEIMMI